jgi:hypothetical protein
MSRKYIHKYMAPNPRRTIPSKKMAVFWDVALGSFIDTD